MPQYRTQSEANAALIAAMIESVGQNVSGMITNLAGIRQKKGEFELDSIGKLNQFAQLPPEERQRRLATPAGRREIMNLLDPHLFGKHDIQKEGPAPTEADVMKFGEPTAIETANLDKARAEADAARLKTKEDQLKLDNLNAFQKAGDAFHAAPDNKKDFAGYTQAGVMAFGPSFLDNAAIAMRPDLAVKQMEAKTYGTPAFFAQKVSDQMPTMLQHFPVNTPEEMRQVQQLVLASVDPSQPLPDKLPESYKGVDQRIADERLTLEQNQHIVAGLKESAEWYKYAANNNVPPEKVSEFVTSIMNTGAPPPGVPMPQDKVLEIQKRKGELDIEKLQGDIKFEKGRNPLFNSLLEQSRAYATANDDESAKIMANKAWEVLKKQYPDIVVPAGKSAWDIFKEYLSAGVAGTASAAGAAAGVMKDAVEGVRAGTQDPNHSQFVNDLKNTGSMISRAVAPGAELGASAVMESIPGIVGLVGKGEAYIASNPQDKEALLTARDRVRNWMQTELVDKTKGLKYNYGAPGMQGPQPGKQPGPPATFSDTITAGNEVSDAGLEALKMREGFRDFAYDDSGGKAIGYGMQTWQGKKVTEDLHVTKAEADKELARQIEEVYKPIVDKALKVPVTQEQYDALISVAYNRPATAVAIAKKLNAGEKLTEKDFQKSATVKGKPDEGLQDRRKQEYAPFAAAPVMQSKMPPELKAMRDTTIKNMLDAMRYGNLDGERKQFLKEIADALTIAGDDAVKVTQILQMLGAGQ